MHFRLSAFQINKVKSFVSLMTTFVPLFNRKPCDCHFHPFIHGLTCHLSYLHTLTWEKGTRRSSLCPSFQPHFMIIAIWILSIHDKQWLVFLATHTLYINKLGKGDFFGGGEWIFRVKHISVLLFYCKQKFDQKNKKCELYEISYSILVSVSLIQSMWHQNN
jgi:hypothetical protein